MRAKPVAYLPQFFLTTGDHTHNHISPNSHSPPHNYQARYSLDLNTWSLAIEEGILKEHFSGSKGAGSGCGRNNIVLCSSKQTHVVLEFVHL